MKSELSQLPDKEGEVDYYDPKVDEKLHLVLLNCDPLCCSSTGSSPTDSGKPNCYEVLVTAHLAQCDVLERAGRGPCQRARRCQPLE
jgi:hypothetical protein